MDIIFVSLEGTTKRTETKNKNKKLTKCHHEYLQFFSNINMKNIIMTSKTDILFLYQEKKSMLLIYLRCCHFW